MIVVTVDIHPASRVARTPIPRARLVVANVTREMGADAHGGVHHHAYALFEAPSEYGPGHERTGIVSGHDPARGATSLVAAALAAALAPPVGEAGGHPAGASLLDHAKKLHAAASEDARRKAALALAEDLGTIQAAMDQVRAAEQTAPRKRPRRAAG